MSGTLYQVEKELKESYKKDYPAFRVGDTIKILYKIHEKGKVRLHPITGIVIKEQGSMQRKSFTVRRISYGESMEVTFPYFSPIIENIEVIQPAKRKVRRAKLNYLRRRVGKKATTV